MPNTSFIHADIFFFVSTIALVTIAAAIVVALVFLIGILKNLRDITDKGKAEWGEILADIQKLRASLRDEGVKWKHVVDLVRTFFVRDAVKKTKAKTTNKTEEGTE